MIVNRFGAGQNVIDTVAVGRKKVLVGDADLLRAARLDREDAGTNQIVADEFE